MALQNEDIKGLAEAIAGVANPTRGRPWRGYKGEPTVVELRCNLTKIGTDGIPVRLEVKGKPGENKTYPRITVPREKAERYVLAKLGKIIEPERAIEVKGREKPAA